MARRTAGQIEADLTQVKDRLRAFEGRIGNLQRAKRDCQSDAKAARSRGDDREEQRLSKDAKALGAALRPLEGERDRLKQRERALNKELRDIRR